MARQTAATARFEARVTTVDATLIVRLPQDASSCLPSRGQVAVEGCVNDVPMKTVLEPDGLKGHWLKLDEMFQRAAGIRAGDLVDVAVEVTPDWPEPDVPPDLAAALAAATPEVRTTWDTITPMARWEWVRWVNATASAATRRRRVDVSVDKMSNGKRRPCCFDLSACTDPALSRNGRLRPDSAT